MKLTTVLTLVTAFYGLDTWACRPNIVSIKHGLAMASIEAVHDKTGASVLDLTSQKMTKFSVGYVERDSRKDCPDLYKATLDFVFTTGTVSRAFQVEVTSESGKPDAIIVSSGTVTSESNTTPQQPGEQAGQQPGEQAGQQPGERSGQ